tara:strand:- start:4353 stop:4529 length:177 start_codon:yes stop_codon:yes gene_type:complete
MKIEINTDNQQIFEYLQELKKEIEVRTPKDEIPEDVKASMLESSLEYVWDQAQEWHRG